MTFRAFLLTSTLLLGAAACTSPSTSENGQTDVAVAEAQAFTLDYEAFTLDNGLEVILQRDASDPIVAVSTVIHAGSSREKRGRTGFAHFFEHMAFNDSENVPRGWNRGQIPKWGGLRNGGTWSDGTIYFEVVPKDAFDKILWIDSDRLGYIINTVTDEALEREKQVVKNEKRQRVDNVAYGYTDEVIRTALYPEDHPYSWTVIGSLPDLQAATLEDVREFYDLWYGPNNATLSIVGDIDIEETKEKVELWFGEIPRGRDIPAPEPRPVSLTDSKNLYFEDDFATLPEIRLTFPTVDQRHEDAVALGILADILGGSRSSPLYVELVETEKLAPNVSAFSNTSELAGTFTIRIRANAGTDLDDVKAAIETALLSFAETGIDPKDLMRVKAEQETALYAELSTVLGKANSMTINNVMYDDPAYAVTSAEKIQSVTADDVQRVFEDYVQGRNFIMTSFVPEGQIDLAVEESERASVWIEEVRADVASEAVTAGAIAVYDKTPTVHDRSEPPFSELPLLQMPNIWTETLSNDIPVYGIETNEIPLISFEIVLPGGGWADTPEQNGRAALLADLMEEGTASKTAAELEQAIGLLGSTISVSSGVETTVIRATTLSRNFEATVDLVAEVLSQPRWNEDDFERVKSARRTSLKGREGNAGAIAANVFNGLMYGESHPFGRASGGSDQTVSELTLDDLKVAHEALLQSPARLHIVGDIDGARAAEGLAPLADLLTPAVDSRVGYEIATTSDARVFFVDVPDAKQSVLRIGSLAPSSNDPDFNRIGFANEKLGGGIAGDLAQVLRIEKGFTYGAGSFIPRGTVERPFIITTSVRANATKASLETIRDMVIEYPNTFDEDVAETVQQKIIKSSAREFESLNAKLGTLREMTQFGLSDRFVEEEQAVLLDMTAEDFSKISQEYLSEDELIYVIVGDRATQFQPVQDFARETNMGDVVELDLMGRRISSSGE